MRIAQRPNPSKKRVSVPTSVPAPILGLNAKDSLADMDARYAITLTNFFPEPDRISVRRGFTEHATQMTDDVKTVMPWIGSAGVKLLASTDDAIFDATDAGTATSLADTAVTSGVWQYQNFTTSGGHYLVMVNGTDSPLNYDGSTVATNSITGTGLTSTNLINVISHKSRLWFVEKNSMNAWYLATNAITGAATKFPLGAIFKDGGSLTAMGTYSDDAGDGLDDYLAFISSNGEVLLYQGTDPASANTWALVSRLKIGSPLGRKCTTNLSGDLLVLTEKGVISIKSAIKYDRAQGEYASVSNKIDPLISTDARSYRSNVGWQITVYPKSSWLLVNVPAAEGLRQYQYIMNTLTGAWCKFDGINANCFASIGDSIYFGGNDGSVYEADTGYKDDGGQINADMKTAFNYFNSRGVQKLFNLIRPVLNSSGAPTISVGASVDFDETTPTGGLTPNVQTAAEWGSATWGSSVWGGLSLVTKKWTALKGVGMCLSVLMRISIRGGACTVNSFDIVMEPGATL